MADLLGIPESQARTELLKAQTEAARGAGALKIRLAEIANYKTPEEINKLRADAYQSYQSGLLSRGKLIELATLLDEKEEAEQLGNDRLIQDINSRISVLFPSAEGGQEEVLVTGSTLVDALTRAMSGEGSDLPERKFLTQQEQTAVDIEKIIRDDSKSTESLARYQDYNRYTNRSKIAVNDKGKVKLIDIPRVGGRRFTGKDVNDLVKSMGLSIDDVYARAKAANVDFTKYLQALIITTEKNRRK